MRWPLLALLLPGVTFAQVFSPGELSRPHQSLEGLKNCTQCHQVGERLSAANCLACHEELEPRVRRGEGFHGRLTPEQKRTCEECHHEHQGLSFPLVDFGKGGKQRFPHDQTGWPLKGEHRKVECEGCHQERRMVDQAILAMLREQPSRTTYLGLPEACSSCHFDEHRGQNGQKTCDRCHDETGFEKAPKFDHGDTRYPLRGKHAKVACKECHPSLTDEKTPEEAFPKPRADDYLKFRPIEHGSCLSCHEDPHEGKFGDDCKSCHTEKDWRQIKTGSKERDFHDDTRYPLEGKHRTVECRACHGPFPGKKAVFRGLPFGKCTDCHLDAHLGQLAAQGGRGPQACESCHAVQGFLPPRFTLAQHENTRYPLEGAHQAVPCSSCHEEDRALRARIPRAVARRLKRWRRPLQVSLVRFDLPGKLERCETCHQDVHAGQFAHRKEGCTACHQVQSFSALTFDHDRDSAFPLEGAHQKAACGSCHREQKGKAGPVRYRPLEKGCASCHEDVHAGQFASAPRAKADCAGCHTSVAWKPLERFDHAPPRTRFALDGQHALLACDRCHRKVTVARGVEVSRYKPLPLACEGCHADFHEGTFQGFVP